MTDLPANWSWVTLNDLQADEPRAITDGPFGSNLTSAHYSDSGARVIRLQNIGDGRFIDAQAYVPMAHFEKLKGHEARAGDLVVASLGEILPKACLVPPNLGPAIVKADCIRVRLGDHVDPRWALYAMQTPQVRRWAAEQLHGVGRPRLGLKVIRQLPVPLPPIDEQRRIVDILEDHLSRLDVGESLLESSQARASRLIRQALRGEFGVTSTGATLPITEVASIINGHTPKGVADWSGTSPSPGTIPFFKVGDMNNGDGVNLHLARSYVPREVAQSLRLRVAPVGTVVFPKRGGSIATNKKRLLGVEAAFDLNTMGVAPGPRLMSEYLYNWFDMLDLRSLADGSNVPQINTPDVAALSLPVPSLERQAEVVERMAAIRQAQSALPIEHLLSRSASLRRALFEGAFSGRLIAGCSSAAERVGVAHG